MFEGLVHQRDPRGLEPSDFVVNRPERLPMFGTPKRPLPAGRGRPWKAFRDFPRLLNLRVEDLGPDYATIVQTKSGNSRRVPLTSELKTELIKQAHKSGYIFGQGKDGKPPQQAAISVAFGRLMRDIGLQGVTHHVLRHTGASAMVAAGISLRVVQDIGGLVDAANAGTLRPSERRRDVARGARAHCVHDRYKNGHSDEKREGRFEERRRRKCCEEWNYEVASPMPASWNQIVSWLKRIDGLRRTA